MIPYRKLGRAGPACSVLALGGHEFHPDGRIMGFADDPAGSVRAGYRQDGFGGPGRQRLLQDALDAGISYLDVTIDPEIEALGRNLSLVAPALPAILVQCRPQAMCYQYDPGNPGLIDPARLRGEIARLLALLQRPQIDILNFGIEAEALSHTADYLARLTDVIAGLKADGLIRMAACDSIRSGEAHYLRMMRAGCFDVVWLNFGLLCPVPEETLLPEAAALGLGVAVREAFGKGALFRMAEQDGAGLDRATLARVALRWVLGHHEVSTAAIGVRTPDELAANLAAAADELDDSDRQGLERLTAGPAFRAERDRRVRSFRSA